MKKLLLISVVCLFLIGLLSCVFLPNPEDNPTLDLSKMKLVWSDEFDYTGSPKTTFWNYELKGGTAIENQGWGNNEKQWYTNSLENSFVQDGVLTIRALKDESYGAGTSWTSARLTTAGKVKVKYGYIEARMKLSDAFGSWPAFWMMPQDSKYGGWPMSGEIDIMEHGPAVSGLNFVYSTLHYGKSLGTHKYTQLVNETIPTATTEFHRYGILWEENRIQYFYDGKPVGVSYWKGAKDHTQWPYDQEFYVILNLAMGGNLGGTIDSDLEAAQVEIDYVRIYQ